VVGVGKKFSDIGDAGATVNLVDDIIGIKPCWAPTRTRRASTGVESIKTPSMSNKIALQEIFGMGHDSQKSRRWKRATLTLNT
jgi:hypothetical protein